MTEEQETAAEPAIIQALLRATPAEQHLLLTWSRALGVIRRGDLPALKKMAAMAGLTGEQKATWPLVKVIGRALKLVVWDRRSWRLRLGVGAVVATFVAVGNGGAGIVALGGGIGLPLWILMAVAGAVAGTVVDWIKNKRTKTKAA
ncbi:MAG TPA: hypothetical protein VES73_16010 [Lamprocystis sp. (in: g-proteobacteria)]|nr:hypothetical protein [Lamprocystis sp. (in: g-proteobacteria)]